MWPLCTALLLVFAFAGCGGNGELTAEERVDVARARADFAHVVLNGSRYGDSLDSVDRLIALFREKPDAEYDGVPLREVLTDAASELDAYQPTMAAELDRAVR